MSALGWVQWVGWKGSRPPPPPSRAPGVSTMHVSTMHVLCRGRHRDPSNGSKRPSSLSPIFHVCLPDFSQSTMISHFLSAHVTSFLPPAILSSSEPWQTESLCPPRRRTRALSTWSQPATARTRFRIPCCHRQRCSTSMSHQSLAAAKPRHFSYSHQDWQLRLGTMSRRTANQEDGAAAVFGLW